MSILRKVHDLMQVTMGPIWSKVRPTYDRYYPRFISLFHLTSHAVVDHNEEVTPTNIESTYVVETGDDVLEYVKELTPAITINNATDHGASDHQESITPASIDSAGGVQLIIAGAASDYGGSITDETTAAQNATVNDMNLMRVSPVAGDAYYYGFNNKCDRVWLNVGTAGAGNWAWQLKYWNGSWVACIDELDNTNEYTVAGLNKIQHTPQSDWALSTIVSKNLYWLKYELVTYVSKTITPKGTQAESELLV